MKMMLEVGMLVNPYAINYPVCTEDGERRAGEFSVRRPSYGQMKAVFLNSLPSHLQSVVLPFTQEEYEVSTPDVLFDSFLSPVEWTGV